ncbi:unnamed protein product [Schistosoma margrebowiei]|uniref:Uncharacterized protein n=1 Tax=Schistosoma margrebowiei TaxID=48269 RepID=A0AA85AM62_9TREM|nr:unnamed protein product [Schistosoma margrebowiei]
MKLAFDNVSNVTCQDNSTCIFFWYTDPVVLSAIILTLIGLFVGLLIILIKKLHSTSIMNSIIMVITLIILIIDVALLNLHTKWYEIIISVTVDTTLTSLAISLGVKLRVPEGKLEIILFSMWCVFGGIGIILLIVGAALFNYIVLGVSWIFWCCIMVIVILYTAYYLDRCSEKQFCGVMYIIFLRSYEYIALNISLQFCLNSFIDCHPCTKIMNNSMIGHYE